MLYILIQLFNCLKWAAFILYYPLIDLDEKEKYIQNSAKVNSIIWISIIFAPFKRP